MYEGEDRTRVTRSTDDGGASGAPTPTRRMAPDRTVVAPGQQGGPAGQVGPVEQGGPTRQASGRAPQGADDPYLQGSPYPQAGPYPQTGPNLQGSACGQDAANPYVDASSRPGYVYDDPRTAPSPRNAVPSPAQQAPYIPGRDRSDGGTRVEGGGAVMSRRHQVPAWALPAALVVVLVIVIALVVSSCSGGSSAKKSDVKAGGNAVTLDGSGSSASSASPAATFDYASLVGERLSNAYALMERAGLDPRGGDPDVSVITSDGKRVVNESNWTVTEASYVAKTNTVSLSVDHEGSDLGLDLGVDLGAIGDSIVGSVGDALGIGGSGSSSGTEGSGESEGDAPEGGSSADGDTAANGSSAIGSGISDLLGSATDQLGEAATQLGEGAGNLVDSLGGLADRFLN